MNELPKKWQEALLRCTETSFIVEEKSKTVVWASGKEQFVGMPCYKAFFDKDSPCAVCPELGCDKTYQWDYYDDKNKHWLKVKNLLFSDGGKIYRASNLNVIDDAMRLNYDSVEQISALQKLLRENQQIKRILERDANYDRMTSLYNRNKFNLDIASGKYDQKGTGILYFDLNNLKEVNDKYRHEAGDALIMCLSRAISETSAVFANTSAYRIGGDEFVLMFSGCTKEILDDAKAYFDEYLKSHQVEHTCVAAVGAVFSLGECDAEKLITEADAAMYADKRRLKGL